jgi:rod shape-determining protein MreD
MSAPLTPALGFRLGILGIFGVIVQISAVSQIQLFGTNADLTPLIVAFAGFLSGSLVGTAFGFAVGLFLDLALMQTLGVSSLLLLAIGYGAGRVRELMDPQGAGVPIVIGATASTLMALGFTIMQFLLGSDAPVSFELVSEILVTIGVDALISAPVFWGVRRWLTPVLPIDPRRRRRRAYTSGGLSPLSRA